MWDTLYDVVPPFCFWGTLIIIENKTQIIPLPLLLLNLPGGTEFCGVTAPLWGATWRIRFRNIHTAHIRIIIEAYYFNDISIVFHNNTLVVYSIFGIPNNLHSDDTSRGEGGAPNWHHKTSYSRPWRTQPQGSESTLGLSEVTKIAFIDWGKQGLDTKISAFFEEKKIRKAKYFTPLIHLLFKKSWSKKKL